MNKDQKISFSKFLAYFPEIELPITLADEDHHTFSTANKPLPALAINQYIAPHEAAPFDELTEFVPCFKLPKTGKFKAVVYWKASLLVYEYVLLTFDKKGNPIDKKIIAGTKAEGQALARTVATITEDWEIFVVGGVVSTDDDSYDPAKSQSINFELMPTGEIVVAIVK